MSRCTIPPAGWACTRAGGHDGPCAAIPTGEHPSGWASPTLGRMYFEAEKLCDDLAQDPENPIGEAMRRLLEAIETADCEIAAVTS